MVLVLEYHTVVVLVLVYHTVVVLVLEYHTVVVLVLHNIPIVSMCLNQPWPAVVIETAFIYMCKNVKVKRTFICDAPTFHQSVLGRSESQSLLSQHVYM